MNSVKLVMNKIAVFINGLSAPIKKDYFLAEWLIENGYDLLRIEPILGETIEKITQEPDLIIGWSMGGLMAPKLAAKYSNSKLILAATGVKVNPSQRTAKALFEMVGTEWGIKLLGVGLKLPKEILINSYEQLNKIPTPNVREKYRKQMEENINLFRSLPEELMKKIIVYLQEVDNNNLLKQLKNKTLVMSGVRDKLMPVSEGRKIANLVVNSELIITGGGHYNVIGRDELPLIKDFLE